MRVTAKYAFFWEGEFSNWHPSEFYNEKFGCTFTCAEQYMMRCKAHLFGDTESEAKIMAEDSPHEQKALGKLVKNFNKEAWEAVAVDLMAEGLYDKFSQNPELKKFILSSGNRILVEASPYDPIWGIGLHYTNDDVLDESKWKGTNYLGIALMKARERIQREQKRC